MTIRAFLVLIGTVSLILTASAQLSHGGEPIGWQNKTFKAQVEHQQLAPLSKSEESKVRNTPFEVGQAFQYGVQRGANINVFQEGKWNTLNDGRKVCRLAVSSPDASMISLQFSEFDLEPGAKLFLYDRKRTHYLGSFTEQNEQPTGDWATSVIPGGTVVVEYIAPYGSSANATRALKIESITHGVLDIFGYGRAPATKDYFPGYSAAGCHNNVVCPIAAGWEDQASSVAMFLRADGAGCTGTLLNNTANDGTPYFYLANHCYQPTESQWVFYFNYESPTCVGDTGQTLQTMVGASYRASDYFDDFALIELFNQPPSAWNVSYSGWDRSNTIPSSTAAILHPAYDVKKFAIDYGAPGSGQGGYGTGVWSTSWNSGGIEAVGSGSPLFDQNKRVIGCMTGAWNSCNPGSGGVVSKLADQWDGINPNGRLRDWLDPSNTAQVVDAYNGGGAPPPPPPVGGIEIPIKVALQGPMDAGTGLMSDQLRLSGLLPNQEPYSGLGFNHINSGGETADNDMLNTSGAQAPVDWVFVELRDASNWNVIISTRAGFVLANGDVVEPDDQSPMLFNVSAGSYFIGIKHRNHLPILTGNTISVSNGMGMIDFTNGSTPLYGGNDATISIGGKRCMFAGDITGDVQVRYTGGSNDRDPILVAVGGNAPTNTVSGYESEDLNFDGVVKYTGGSNDRDLVLINVGGNSPTSSVQGFYPVP